MKTLRIVILEDDAGARSPLAPAGASSLGGIDPRRLEGLSGSDAAALLRRHALPMSFVETDAGGLDDGLDAQLSLEDRLHEALHAADEQGSPLPMLLLPPDRHVREDAGHTQPAGLSVPERSYPLERLNDSLVRMLRRHEVEATLTETEARLRQIGLRDARHGLPRRELFIDRLEQAASAVQRGGVSFTVLMIGVELGAELSLPTEDGTVAPGSAVLGPILLDAMAARLQRHGRRADSFTRIGGLSFAGLLIGSSSVAASVGLAGRLAEDLARPVMVAGRSLQPLVSIGVALCPQHGNDARQLLLHAHAALEQAQAGRQAVSVYDPRYSRALHGRSTEGGSVTMPLQGESLAPLLGDALGTHELRPVFQPVVDLLSGRLRQLEVLARWQLPHEGSVSPREFIAVAEHHGLISALTDQILDQALAAARPWRVAGLDACLSVNLSVLLLADLDLPLRVEQALQRHGWPAQALQFEISAPALLQHGDSHPQVLAALRALGVRLAVDDFGSGLMSPLSVTELGPVDQLKVDLAALRADPRAGSPGGLRAILACAAAFAHGLDAELVVKGLEQAADVVALHELGVDAVQGFLCAAPLPVGQVRAWWIDARSRPLAWMLAPQDSAAAVDIDLFAPEPAAQRQVRGPSP
ncbi:MAG: GGDEF domain-containing protein [Burkholderiales bacterium]|jgi:diguanylate cyclase (GGDEF)-like protein|nr:GGDEF domain-containing protein [Burkholderiales bacterium]MBP7518878.1 GGDEF domain-containing protein [Leptothrix sp. (in: b-proteobacteria)]